METEELSKEEVVELKKVFAQQAENLPYYVRELFLQLENEGSDVSGVATADRGAEAEGYANREGFALRGMGRDAKAIQRGRLSLQ